MFEVLAPEIHKKFLLRVIIEVSKGDTMSDTITTSITNENFVAEVSPLIRALTSANIGKPAWVEGVEIVALARDLDTSAVTADFLVKEIELRKSHFFLDSHNWSDITRQNSWNFIQFCESLLADK